MAKKKKYTPRELMEKTFEESLKSIPEHSDKPDPLVGAIITTPDGEILAKAHRGELRIGEHCEYTLIERKLKSVNLKGCVFYVTLEPCIDKVRTPPKRGCSTYIVKARIGKVYIGMRDPDIDIENEGANFLIENRIEVQYFPTDLNDKIRASLKEFIAYKEAEKLKILAEKEVPKIEYLKQGVSTAKVDRFSKQAIETFIKYSNVEFSYPSNEFVDWAINFNLANRISKGNIAPTKLGLLLFGENAEEIFPHIIFKVEVDYGKGEPEVRDFGGPIVNQMPEILDFIRDKVLKLTIDRSEGKRKIDADFPIEALRAVIANAIIHRDYSLEQSTNYIYISTDIIIIRSPGLPVPPLTIEDIRSMNVPSISRNPKIMYVYNRMGLAEQRGIGLRSLRSLPQKGFPLPIFNLKGNIFEIVFGRAKSLIPEMIGFHEPDLSAEDREGLFFIQQNEPITVKQYAEKFKLTDKTAQRRLAELIDKGFVEKVGEKRWTKYQNRKLL